MARIVEAPQGLAHRGSQAAGGAMVRASRNVSNLRRAQDGAGSREAWPLAVRIRAEAGSTRVDVYDDIGDGGLFGAGISAKDFAAQMAAVKGPVSCHINSGGGDVFDGIAIYNALKAHAGRVTTVVDGLAASIASVIFQAGDDRVGAPGSMVMIHDAFGVCVGNAAEMAKMAKMLNQVSDNLAGVYASRCGGTADSWRDAMSAETWYTAEQAVAAGLADRVSGAAAQLPASVGVAAAGTVPGRIAARLRSMPQAAALRAVTGGGRAESAAAALDRFPWARSWGSFLSAVRDPGDEQGARAAIAKAMASRPRNDMGERVPSEGGYLVPERLTSDVLSYMQTGIIRPRCTVVPMDAYRVSAPILDNPSQASGAQALGGMAWNFTQEGQPITATVPQFGRVTLEAWPDKALLKNVPNELLADATAFTFTESFLPQVIAKGLSWHVDDLAIYQGTGAGQPQALAIAEAAVKVSRNTSSEVLHADVVAMLKSLHPASKATATWLASEDVFDQLLELYELAGSSPTSTTIPPPNVLKCQNGRWELFGLELIPNDHQPAVGTPGDLVLVDLAVLLLGELGELTVDVSSKGSGFSTDSSNLRFRYRWDSRFWLQQAVTLANGKVTSPLVVLQ
jgi:HK97 family phage major capsid protein